MKIVLVQDVSNLGHKGEIKEVAEGYARNFLLPRKLAVLPNNSQIKEIVQERTVRKTEEKKIQQEISEKAEKLNGRTFIFRAKADKKDHLYGSIGPKELSAKIGLDEGLFTEHYKKLGTFPLEIKISSGKIVKMSVVIEKEN